MSLNEKGSTGFRDFVINFRFLGLSRAGSCVSLLAGITLLYITLYNPVSLVLVDN